MFKPVLISISVFVSSLSLGSLPSAARAQSVTGGGCICPPTSSVGESATGSGILGNPAAIPSVGPGVASTPGAVGGGGGTAGGTIGSCVCPPSNGVIAQPGSVETSRQEPGTIPPAPAFPTPGANPSAGGTP